MITKFEIQFSGHKNIRSTHKTTLEITTEQNLTINGNCIIGVNATCGCSGIPTILKKLIKKSTTFITITIVVKNSLFQIHGIGNDDLSLINEHDIVLRKSNYISPRTLAINCDRSSISLPRYMIKELQNPKTNGKFIITVIH